MLSLVQMYLRVGKSRALLVQIQVNGQSDEWFSVEAREHLVSSLKTVIPEKLTREATAKEKELADIYMDDLIQFAYFVKPLPVRHSLLQRVQSETSYSYNGLQLHASMLVVCVEKIGDSAKDDGTLNKWVLPTGSKPRIKKVLQKPTMSGIKYGKNIVYSGPEGVLEM